MPRYEHGGEDKTGQKRRRMFYLFLVIVSQTGAIPLCNVAPHRIGEDVTIVGDVFDFHAIYRKTYENPRKRGSNIGTRNPGANARTGNAVHAWMTRRILSHLTRLRFREIFIYR